MVAGSAAMSLSCPPILDGLDDDETFLLGDDLITSSVGDFGQYYVQDFSSQLLLELDQEVTAEDGVGQERPPEVTAATSTSDPRKELTEDDGGQGRPPEVQVERAANEITKDGEAERPPEVQEDTAAGTLTSDPLGANKVTEDGDEAERPPEVQEAATSTLTSTSDARPYACPEPGCEKRFSSPHSLRCHSRVHTSARPHSCGLCRKAFKTSGDLHKHSRTHTGERPFRCEHPHCGKAFTTSNILKVSPVK